jgi:hypothetical protein
MLVYSYLLDFLIERHPSVHNVAHKYILLILLEKKRLCLPVCFFFPPLRIGRDFVEHHNSWQFLFFIASSVMKPIFVAQQLRTVCIDYYT